MVAEPDTLYDYWEFYSESQGPPPARQGVKPMPVNFRQTQDPPPETRWFTRWFVCVNGRYDSALLALLHFLNLTRSGTVLVENVDFDPDNKTKVGPTMKKLLQSLRLKEDDPANQPNSAIQGAEARRTLTRE
jgi:hypothetical protein